jgi:hypothetical protein
MLFPYVVRMPAGAYRPIKDSPVKSTVPKTVIGKAVRELKHLRKADPEKYKARIEAAGAKQVRLVAA